MSTADQLDLGACDSCGAEDWEIQRFGPLRRSMDWILSGRPVRRYRARCRRCGFVVEGGEGGEGFLSVARYTRGPGWWAAPVRAFRVLRDERTAIPAPIHHVLAGVVGSGLGVALDVVIGWPWWLVAMGTVIAVWVAYMATAFRRVGAGVPESLRTQLRDALDPKGALARYDRRMEAVVRTPPFPLFGLADSWRGPRFIGGAGWGGIGREARIESIELAHGDPLDETGPRLRVESSAAHPTLPREMILRDLAVGLWQETERPPANLPAERFRSWVDARERAIRRRETPSFAPVEISVNGRHRRFDHLSSGANWIAYGIVDDVTLKLSARNLSPDEVELVTVREPEPYIAGTRLLRERHHQESG